MSVTLFFSSFWYNEIGGSSCYVTIYKPFFLSGISTISMEPLKQECNLQASQRELLGQVHSLSIIYTYSQDYSPQRHYAFLRSPYPEMVTPRDYYTVNLPRRITRSGSFKNLSKSYNLFRTLFEVSCTRNIPWKITRFWIIPQETRVHRQGIETKISSRNL